ncbi:hypothetical protein OVA24_21155 [Luteolibacter sp. SL250]|uniref:hypothetical protein n=1 Tax=Luteolibacter sp. SL250 TaxID=2995170 RepID=UPI00226E5344|nr:hypothetical protein [Luteolibacter sp. SL250]WAC19730.1 hypothetical protein OVA24_21155 [Luteolibacter sp. SL250]
MKQDEAEELLSLLPGGRTLFTYGKDGYAISLLRMGMERACHEELKKTSLGRLFEKPQIRTWLGSLGKKAITPGDLDMLWPQETETYRLTAGLYGGWSQTTRKGNRAWNIVLQLNLNSHDVEWMNRIQPERDRDPFERRFHPIHRGLHRTLAWARIDLDWSTGEALIEEIQNDRLREVRWDVDRILSQQLTTVRVRGVEIDAALVLRYWNERLRLSRQFWDEAMLCAAIRFIVEELGIRRIWYHSPVSGARLKNVKDAPVSLYTDLPRRFCFEKTAELPKFVRRPKRRHRPGLWMHRLCL